MKNFSKYKISRVIRLYNQGKLSKREAEKLIVLHHNLSTVVRSK